MTSSAASLTSCVAILCRSSCRQTDRQKVIKSVSREKPSYTTTRNRDWPGAARRSPSCWPSLWRRRSVRRPRSSLWRFLPPAPSAPPHLRGAEMKNNVITHHVGSRSDAAEEMRVVSFCSWKTWCCQFGFASLPTIHVRGRTPLQQLEVKCLAHGHDGGWDHSYVSAPSQPHPNTHFKDITNNCTPNTPIIFIFLFELFISYFIS